MPVISSLLFRDVACHVDCVNIAFSNRSGLNTNPLLDSVGVRPLIDQYVYCLPPPSPSLCRRETSSHLRLRSCHLKIRVVVVGIKIEIYFDKKSGGIGPKRCDLIRSLNCAKAFPFQLNVWYEDTPWHSLGLGLIHTGLGSWSLIAHVLHSPPPPT